MKNADKPAYPVLDKLVALGTDLGLELKDPGLTKREYFAAMAMQGLLANPKLLRMVSGEPPQEVLDIYTEAAIEHADELLKQLES